MTIDWAAILSGVFGGGASFTVLTTVMGHRYEQSAQRRDAKSTTVQAFMESDQTARAALADLRNLVHRCKNAPAGSSAGPDRLPISPREEVDATEKSLHAAIRACRPAAVKMVLSFPASAKVAELSWEIINAFYHARNELMDAVEAFGSGAGEQDMTRYLEKVKSLGEEREEWENELILIVHRALWPRRRWWPQSWGLFERVDLLSAPVTPTIRAPDHRIVPASLPSRRILAASPPPSRDFFPASPGPGPVQFDPTRPSGPRAD